MQNNIGEIASLATAVCWTVTSLSFERAAKAVGSISVNIIRLVLAFFYLGILGWISRGMFLPLDAGGYEWFWLTISGLVGFVLGDLFLFKAFAMIGSRVSMLVMTLVPPITAVIGFAMLGEQMTWIEIFGMTLVVTGIALAILSKRNKGSKRFQFSYSTKGLLFALGGAVGQAVGLVLSKKGMGEYDAFAATHIRIIAGMIGFAFVVIYLKRSKQVIAATKNRKGMVPLTIGSIFGPFLGVSLSLYAVQHTETGVASTIMAIVPILIIPPAVFIFKEKVSLREVLGALVSIGGVALLLLY